MYSLIVHHTDAGQPPVTLHLDRAAEVLTAVSDLLREYPECARIDVTMGAMRLFSVDCAGNRLP